MINDKLNNVFRYVYVEDKNYEEKQGMTVTKARIALTPSNRRGVVFLAHGGLLFYTIHMSFMSTSVYIFQNFKNEHVWYIILTKTVT